VVSTLWRDDVSESLSLEEQLHQARMEVDMLRQQFTTAAVSTPMGQDLSRKPSKPAWPRRDGSGDGMTRPGQPASSDSMAVQRSVGQPFGGYPRRDDQRVQRCRCRKHPITAPCFFEHPDKAPPEWMVTPDSPSSRYDRYLPQTLQGVENSAAVA